MSALEVIGWLVTLPALAVIVAMIGVALGWQ